jgi:exopolysaccharide biosynthesis WecB/TagA/CpsF family protein
MKVTLLKCKIDNLSMGKVLEKINIHVKTHRPISITTVNVDTVVKANRDKQLLSLINRSSIVTADGMPLVFFSKLLGKNPLKRVPGVDLFFNLLPIANLNNWKVFFLGAKSDVLKETVAKTREEYPGIKIVGWRSGFWEESDENSVIDEVKRSRPDILFVALGVPKQEKFIIDNLEKLKVSVAVGLGGTFNVYIGRAKRAPAFIQNYGMEWFYRFCQEPKRLFKRYFVDDMYIFVIFWKDILTRFFSTGPTRSRNIKKNIFTVLLFKGLAIILSLALVPLTIHLIGLERYGTFLVISAFLGWITFFDFGLANGFRNEFAQAIASKKHALARSYVSTAYFAISSIVIFLTVLFLILSHWIDWVSILNVSTGDSDVRTVIVIIFVTMCLQLILNVIGIIFTADQKPAYNSVIALFSTVLMLLSVLVLSIIHSSNFLYYSTVMIIAPVIVLIGATIWSFKTKYKKYAPSISYINLKLVKNILGLGIQFFIIQLCLMVILQTDNLIISKLFGPAEVVPYNVAYKYFGLITTIFMVFAMPFWSAATEAFVKQDVKWIRGAVTSLRKAWIGFVVLGLLMLVASPWIYSLWFGSSIRISFGLSSGILIYVALVNLGYVFTPFINGSGKIKLQLVCSIIGMVLNIPLAILLSHYFSLGIYGIIISNCICMFYGYAIAPYQLRLMLARLE